MIEGKNILEQERVIFNILRFIARDVERDLRLKRMVIDKLTVDEILAFVVD